MRSERCRHCDPLGRTPAKIARRAIDKAQRAATRFRDSVRTAERPRDTILTDRPGFAPRGGDVLCTFAHFDPQGVVDPYVLHYLRELRKLSWDVLFVTTSKLGAGQYERVAPLCARVIERRNVGLDFASWIAALDGEDLSRRSRVVFANDSVYGPMHDLQTVFDAMAPRRLDVWGLTESFERDWHVQSYFLVFERSALDAGFVDALRSGVEALQDKERIIDRYEVGLARTVRGAGLSIGGLWQPDELWKKVCERPDFQYRDHPLPMNATQLVWDILVRDLGFPFLKTDVMKNDWHRSRSMPRWRSIVERSGYDADLIASHLARIGSRVPG